MQNKPTSNNLQKAAGPLVFLLIFVLICAFLAQYLTGSETLLDYAQKNPELAYGTDHLQTTPEDTGTDRLQTTPTGTDTQQQPPQQEHADASSGMTDRTNVPDADTVDGHSAYNTAEDAATGSSGLSASSAPAADAGSATTDTAGSDRKKENDNMSASTDRTTYQDGFYYEPLSEEIKQRITGISYPESGCTVPYEDLNYVGLLYVDFNGEVQEGELICHKDIAQDMVEIFHELYLNDYRIESVRLIDEFGGDDTLSMEHNNTSCFNYRVVDGTTSLSKHALGCAIDINPFYNPYVVYNRPVQGETYISPKGSEIYADRSKEFPYKIDENDLCYKLFTSHGFTWGGNWNSSKDYQHFQIVF